MAHREGNKSQIIKELSKAVAETITELREGDEASIAQLVSEWHLIDTPYWQRGILSHNEEKSNKRMDLRNSAGWDKTSLAM